jgi:hypothetical protein
MRSIRGDGLKEMACWKNARYNFVFAAQVILFTIGRALAEAGQFWHKFFDISRIQPAASG